MITDEDGAVVARSSFDAFGQRRQPLTWADGFPTSSELNAFREITTRGYTGHQQIDAANLIHMNGRIYDPELGRFISPNQNIPEPGNTQAYNRYSYVYNNPLRYTDPSGFVAKDGRPNQYRDAFPISGYSNKDRFDSGSFGAGYVNADVLEGRGVTIGANTPRVWVNAIKVSIAKKLDFARRSEAAKKLDLNDLMAMSPQDRGKALDNLVASDVKVILGNLDPSMMVADNQLGEIEKQQAYWKMARATPYERMLGMKLGFGLAVDVIAISSDLGYIDMPGFFHDPVFGVVDVAGGVSSYFAAQGMVAYDSGGAVYFAAGVVAFGGGYAIGHGINKMTDYWVPPKVTDMLCSSTGNC